MANSSVSTEALGSVQQVAYKGRKLRVAIVGCGGISDIHLRTFAEMPDVEVVAGVDLRPERRAWAQEKHGVKRVYSDWKSMLRELKPDAVDVCTPNGQHAPVAIGASNAGCHVFVEKPMAMTPSECNRMIAAARKARKVLVTGFQYRYHPTTQMIRRFSDEGRLGRIMFAQCRALRRRGVPNWGVFGRKDLQGGGPMIDIGVHVIEMTHYAMGRPRPVAATGNIWTYMGNRKSDVVSGWPNWDWKSYTVEDFAVGHVRFENGAVMHIEAMFCGHIEKDVWTFSLTGDKGSCTWDPAALFTDQAGTMVNITPAWLPQGDFPSMFKSKLRNFVDGCLKGTALEAPGEDGLAVQKIIDGVYRSAAAGREVAII